MDAIYVRISEDQDGLEAGVDRQRQDALALAKKNGVEIPESMQFVDNDISASTLSTKPRPQWNRLAKLIEAGKVKSVWAYSNSRLTRRPRELDDLINLYQRTGVEFHTVTGGKDDLSTADGRMVARIKADVDAAEAERISERTTRQKRQRAEQGKPQGGRTRLYGYTSDWQVVPEEAEILKEAFKRRASGESINSIANDLAARGATTAEFTCQWHTARFERSGKVRPSGVAEGRETCDKCRPGRLWKSGTLLSTLRNPTYAGLRSYKGEVVGSMEEGFPAIIDTDTYDAAQAVTAEKPKSLNTRRYLLSGFARCGMCGGRMTGRTSSRRATRYRCAEPQGGCGVLSIRCDWIDEPVLMTVAAYEIAERSRTKPEEGTETDELDQEVRRLNAELKELQSAVVEGTINAASALPMITGLEGKLSKAKSAQRKHTAQKVADNWVFKTLADLLNMSIGEQRALMDKHIAMIKVDPAPTKGRNSMDLSRVELHFRDGTVERLSNSVPSHPLVNAV